MTDDSRTNDAIVARTACSQCRIVEMEVDCLYRYKGIGTTLLKLCEDMRKNAYVYAGPTLAFILEGFMPSMAILAGTT